MRDELTVQDGLIFRGERVVIPSSLRQVMKQKVHSSHMGIDSCLRRAREHIYWTAMSAEIKQQIEACETCGKFGMNQPKEPLMPHEVPSRPWEKVGTDIFEHDTKGTLSRWTTTATSGNLIGYQIRKQALSSSNLRIISQDMVAQTK